MKKQKYEKIIFGAIIFLVVAGFIWLAIELRDNSPNQLTVLPIDAAASLDWTKGNKDAKAILIEYSDFQCPACAVYQPVVKQLIEEFGNQMIFAYRHFPLKSIHRNAELAAIASEAAGQQGKFWEMHDLIFEKQKEWSEARKSKAEELFAEYAQSLGLDAARFKNDLDSGELKSKVNNDLISGEAAGVNATPTFFLNGRRVQPRSYEEFRQLIEASDYGKI